LIKKIIGCQLWYHQKGKAFWINMSLKNEFDAAFMEAIRTTDVRASCIPQIPVITGRLRASLFHYPNAADKSWEVTNEAPYASFVEFGTSRMAPRETIARSLPAIAEDFGKKLISELDKIDVV
jgi:hypothetical protein